jgi:hypothetical protein
MLHLLIRDQATSGNPRSSRITPQDVDRLTWALTNEDQGESGDLEQRFQAYVRLKKQFGIHPGGLIPVAITDHGNDRWLMDLLPGLDKLRRFYPDDTDLRQDLKDQVKKRTGDSEEGTMQQQDLEALLQAREEELLFGDEDIASMNEDEQTGARQPNTPSIHSSQLAEEQERLREPDSSPSSRPRRTQHESRFSVSKERHRPALPGITLPHTLPFAYSPSQGLINLVNPAGKEYHRSFLAKKSGPKVQESFGPLQPSPAQPKQNKGKDTMRIERTPPYGGALFSQAPSNAGVSLPRPFAGVQDSLRAKQQGRESRASREHRERHRDRLPMRQKSGSKVSRLRLPSPPKQNRKRGQHELSSDDYESLSSNNINERRKRPRGNRMTNAEVVESSPSRSNSPDRDLQLQNRAPTFRDRAPVLRPKNTMEDRLGLTHFAHEPTMDMATVHEMEMEDFELQLMRQNRSRVALDHKKEDLKHRIDAEILAIQRRCRALQIQKEKETAEGSEAGDYEYEGYEDEEMEDEYEGVEQVDQEELGNYSPHYTPGDR